MQQTNTKKKYENTNKMIKIQMQKKSRNFKDMVINATVQRPT